MRAALGFLRAFTLAALAWAAWSFAALLAEVRARGLSTDTAARLAIVGAAVLICALVYHATTPRG